MTELRVEQQSCYDCDCSPYDDTGGTGTAGYSSAAALVEVAAYRIDLDQDRLDVVLDNLWKECIKEEWQLQHLDSLNYRMLQVPIGLAASIRACLLEKQYVEEDGYGSGLIQRNAVQCLNDRNCMHHGNGVCSIYSSSHRRESSSTLCTGCCGSLSSSMFIPGPPLTNSYRTSMTSSEDSGNSPALPRIPRRRSSCGTTSASSISRQQQQQYKQESSTQSFPTLPRRRSSCGSCSNTTNTSMLYTRTQQLEVQQGQPQQQQAQLPAVYSTRHHNDEEEEDMGDDEKEVDDGDSPLVLVDCSSSRTQAPSESTTTTTTTTTSQVIIELTSNEVLIVEEDEGMGEEHHEHEHAIGRTSSRRGSTFSLPELPVRKASIISTLSE
jgi:hypothetical protein